MNPSGRLTLVLLAGFAVAVAIRVAIGGPGVAQSAPAGIVFAACLVALGLAGRTPLRFTSRAVVAGVAGGAFLCLPAVIARSFIGGQPVSATGFWSWAVVVAIVAAAEEYFLRGTLYDAANQWHGETAAIALGAAAFAALHVPLYGWHVVPLDLAVGLWLGACRAVGRSSSAPAIAHVVADLAAWWLR